MITEDRLIEIETKIAHQENTVESLNQVVYQQQKKIDHLEGMLSALAKHVKDMVASSGEASSGHEKPPHY